MAKQMNKGRKVLMSLLIAVALSSACVSMAKDSSKGITFNVISHMAHKKVATTGNGGSVLDIFLKEHKDVIKEVDWETQEISGVHERLFREAALPKTALDVAYLIEAEATPRIRHFLEPLNSYLEKNPIPGFPEDFPPALVDAVTFDGKIYAIPVRTYTSVLHWNRAVFEERGIKNPPTTVEEFKEVVQKLTFTRKNGEKVYGFGKHVTPILHTLSDLTGWYGGELITPDLRVVCDQPPAVKGLELLVWMYKNGFMPPETPSMSHADLELYAQLGNIAMTSQSPGKTDVYNDPDASRVAGKWDIAPLPLAEEVSDRFEATPTHAGCWYLTIPANAQRKELSWEFIRTLSSEEGSLMMALNGNVPTRLSVYDREEYYKTAKEAGIVQKQLKVARFPLPSFEKASQAEELIDIYAKRALLGELEPQEAMDLLAKELRKFKELK